MITYADRVRTHAHHKNGIYLFITWKSNKLLLDTIHRSSDN